jgi:hypothetical protein
MTCSSTSTGGAAEPSWVRKGTAEAQGGRHGQDVEGRAWLGLLGRYPRCGRVALGPVLTLSNFASDGRERPGETLVGMAVSRRLLARRKPGVQNPLTPPPTSQVRASPASSRRRSPHLGPRWGRERPWKGCSTSAGERLPKLVDRQSNPSLNWVNDWHSWRLMVLARGPVPVAHRSAG